MDNINLDVVRESFGKIVYTHKTYEKAAEICFNKGKSLKLSNVFLLALTSGSAIGSFISEPYLRIISSILATLTLIFSIYQLNTNYEALGQDYKKIANELWFIRERYQNFIADIMNNTLSDIQISQKRDQLLVELNEILSCAPPTSNKAYLKARKSLKFEEEMTFSNEEIDEFLPNSLRVSKK